MTAPTAPRFPVYIPSKSRATIATTPHVLAALGVPHRIIVEDHQHDDYAATFGADRLLVLPRSYQDAYDTCDVGVDPAKSKGPGPARNFAWEHSLAEGAPWHWVMDDNIQLFARLHENKRVPVGDGLIFAAMEDFVLRYRNVGQAGPDYWMFAPSRSAARPFTLNTRIYSCNLIRNDLAFRWRGRYNEDTDLSLQMLKAGWCTVLFKAFLQFKTTTQVLPGGNTEAFYATEGTTPKSQMVVDLHPDVCRIVRRWGRVHHVCDYSPWRNQRLVRRDDVDLSGPNPYSMKLVPRTTRRRG